MEDNAELESFRRQWREEVLRRGNLNAAEPSQPTPTRPVAPQPRQFPPTRHEASARKEDEEEGPVPYDQNEIVQGVDRLSLNKHNDEDAFHSRESRAEPTSALEHFERAVEREAEGNLGDSLQLYRKAYRVSRRHSFSHEHQSWGFILTVFSWMPLSTRSTGISILLARGRKRHNQVHTASLPKRRQLNSRQSSQHRNLSAYLRVRRFPRRTPYLKAIPVPHAPLRIFHLRS